jgi:N-acetylmuramoyl-L-alanine amidase
MSGASQHMTVAIEQQPSANYDQRTQPPDTIMLHYTGMPSAEAALARLRDPAAKVSAHYVIGRDGTVWQLVAEAERAWHAGVGSWRGVTDMNNSSIGIELVNRGHEWGYQDFPPAQMQACLSLLRGIISRYSIAPRQIIGHSDAAPQRKEDPGEQFPWAWLATAGIGLWPALPPATEPTPPPLPTSAIRALLGAIGYECAATGDYDPALRRVLLAFQRHWLPQQLSGIADAPTVARLLAVQQACHA